MIEHALGTITRGDDMLADRVNVWFEKVQHGKLYDWHGGLTLPGGVSMPTGGRYRLKLDDGRSGDILITSMRVVSIAKTEATFEGSGPLE